jgi:hypothetical protein
LAGLGPAIHSSFRIVADEDVDLAAKPGEGEIEADGRVKPG